MSRESGSKPAPRPKLHVSSTHHECPAPPDHGGIAVHSHRKVGQIVAELAEYVKQRIGRRLGWRDAQERLSLLRLRITLVSGQLICE